MSNGTNDWFARRQTLDTSPFELNNEGRGQALVLRYAGCNLRCPLCYAWRYAWFMKNGYLYNLNNISAALNHLSSTVSRKIVWTRIQGGEPCLNYDRTLNTMEFAILALNAVHNQSLNFYNTTRAVIQTNGIVFGLLSDKQLNSLKIKLENLLQDLKNGKVVLEFSFKSSNDMIYLKPQLKGFDAFLQKIVVPLWDKGIRNISVYPLAGLGPSIDFHNVWIVPIETLRLPQEIPLFHQSAWSPEFRNMVTNFVNNIVPAYGVYSDFRSNPKTFDGHKIAIEELEPTPFQSSWISGYAGKYNELDVTNVPSIDKILRKSDNNLDPQWCNRLLFNRYPHWRLVADKIPTANNPDIFLKSVKDMNNYFYPSHPIGHYPYL